MQGIDKRMVRFQKLIRNLFLFSHRNNMHCQQRELSIFLRRYEQFASLICCWAAGPDSEMALQQEKAFCELRFELPRFVFTV
jgi:hypothetical protein